MRGALPHSPGVLSTTPINLYNLSLEELQSLFESWGEPAYRAKQVYRHLYVHLAADFAGMTDLPATLRDRLATETRIGDLEPVKMQQGDGGLTRKVLFRLPGGETVEAVLMVYPERATVCVSSQAGCPMGCVFCATAKLGFLCDLTRGQIVQQALWAAREVRKIRANPGDELASGALRGGVDALPASLSNVVFMGMGEAFNNYDEWWGSVERLHDPAGFNMGARSFTVSTVGLAPGIRRLAEAPLPVNLAISLHAADDEVRGAMMPVNKAYPIQTLLEAARDYAVRTGRRVSFEYVLLEGKNDEPAQAERLAEVLGMGPLKDCRSLIHVNLIPWNPVPGSPLARSSRERVAAFQRILRDRGIPCTVRVERGRDIDAACGQLAGNA